MSALFQTLINAATGNGPIATPRPRARFAEAGFTAQEGIAGAEGTGVIGTPDAPKSPAPTSPMSTVTASPPTAQTEPIGRQDNRRDIDAAADPENMVRSPEYGPSTNDLAPTAVRVAPTDPAPSVPHQDAPFMPIPRRPITPDAPIGRAAPDARAVPPPDAPILGEPLLPNINATGTFAASNDPALNHSPATTPTAPPVDSTPGLHITIGRIEIVQPARQTAPPRSENHAVVPIRAAPRLSLDEQLARRRGR